MGGINTSALGVLCAGVANISTQAELGPTAVAAGGAVGILLASIAHPPNAAGANGTYRSIEALFIA